MCGVLEKRVRRPPNLFAWGWALCRVDTRGQRLQTHGTHDNTHEDEASPPCLNRPVCEGTIRCLFVRAVCRVDTRSPLPLRRCLRGLRSRTRPIPGRTRTRHKSFSLAAHIVRFARPHSISRLLICRLRRCVESTHGHRLSAVVATGQRDLRQATLVAHAVREEAPGAPTCEKANRSRRCPWRRPPPRLQSASSQRMCPICEPVCRLDTSPTYLNASRLPIRSTCWPAEGEDVLAVLAEIQPDLMNWIGAMFRIPS